MPVYELARVKFYHGAVGSDSFVGSGFEVMPQTTWEDGLTGYYIISVHEPDVYATGLLLVLFGAVWLVKTKNKGTTRHPMR